MNETMKSILQRRSVRAYKSAQITDEELSQILLAGQYTASARNEQPWHFTVVRSKELIDWIVSVNIPAILESGVERFIARAKTPVYSTFYHAPTVLFVSGNASAKWARGDCSAAAQNMAVAAHSLGVGSCIIGLGLMGMTGENLRVLKERLQLPEGYEPVITLALGYPDESPSPAERRAGTVNYV